MRPISGALNRLRPQGDPPDDFDPEAIERMLGDRLLWPAERIKADLAAARTEHLALGFGPRDDRHQANVTVERLERDLELAEWRDRVQATRPPGCWCLGIGGHGRIAYGLDAQDEPLLSWRVWCDCPEAQALLADVHARQLAFTQARGQQVIDRLFGTLPEKFKPWTLETLAEQSEAHARLAERIHQWLDEDKRWLYLWGEVGRGKSGAAVGAIKALAERGYTCLFVETVALLKRLRDRYADAVALSQARDELWESLAGVNVLVIDDIGAEYHRGAGGVDWASEQLWHLIGTRHSEMRRTIITSNGSLDNLTAVLGHPRVSSRIQEVSLVLDCSLLPYLRESDA